MKRFKLLSVITILAAFCLISCQNKSSTIKIGLLSVFSGDGANYGETAKTGVDLAVDEINNQGGINGRKIEIIYEDSKGTSKDALNGFQKLVTSDKVPAVIGPFYSNQVLTCAGEANKNKVVLLTGSATGDDITYSGEYIFRVCPTNNSQGKTLAEFCREKGSRKH